MAKKIEKWLAATGETFDTEAEADACDARNKLCQEIAHILTQDGLYAATAGGTALSIVRCWPAIKAVMDSASRGDPHRAPDADFEAENDANEAPRRRNPNRVQEHQKDETTNKCMDCGSRFYHDPKCPQNKRGAK